jgi:hypothetical protein
VGKKFVLAACLAIAICLPVSQANAHTPSITIGEFKYVGTVSGVSSYEVHLDTTNITIEPISFSNVILFVKGTKQGSGPITTGLGCGLPPYEAPCVLRFEGGAMRKAEPRARIDANLHFHSSAACVLDREEFQLCPGEW